jgi:hypothetical protein
VRHPIFARVYERVSVAMDRAGDAGHRPHLVAGLSGRVIGVGAGNGRTFGFEIARLRRFSFPPGGPAAPHILGSATRPADMEVTA